MRRQLEKELHIPEHSLDEKKTFIKQVVLKWMGENAKTEDGADEKAGEKTSHEDSATNGDKEGKNGGDEVHQPIKKRKGKRKEIDGGSGSDEEPAEEESSAKWHKKKKKKSDSDNEEDSEAETKKEKKKIKEENNDEVQKKKKKESDDEGRKKKKEHQSESDEEKKAKKPKKDDKHNKSHKKKTTKHSSSDDDSEDDHKRKKSRKKKDPNETEEQKLRKIVSLCGLRATGLKDFSEEKRVAALKKLLRDNGLVGRVSKERAKKFKEQRELQQDVESLQTNVPLDLPRSARSCRTRNAPIVDAFKEVDRFIEENGGTVSDNDSDDDSDVSDEGLEDE